MPPATSEPVLGGVAALATRGVPTARPDERVGVVRDGLAGDSFEWAGDIAVLDGTSLVGVVPIELLLRAPADATIASVMDDDPPVVEPGADHERAAWTMVHRGESSIAVVDVEGCFTGLIPPHRLVGALLAEHDADFARLGGYLAGTRSARLAAEEPVRQRLWHRLPWLLIGLLGAMLSAALVGAFEEELSKNVLLAFFIPAVVYMADAVGTQTEAVLIRGLSVGVELRKVVRRELLSGAVIGVVLALLFVPFALLGWGDAGVAAAVSLALFAACAIATSVAMLLPWLFSRAGVDPAFGSGPLATVVQDLLSIAVYFAVAVPIAT